MEGILSAQLRKLTFHLRKSNLATNIQKQLNTAMQHILLKFPKSLFAFLDRVYI